MRVFYFAFFDIVNPAFKIPSNVPIDPNAITYSYSNDCVNKITKTALKNDDKIGAPKFRRWNLNLKILKNMKEIK